VVGAVKRAVLVIVVFVAGAPPLLGCWSSGPQRSDAPAGQATPGANTERAREVGAEVGERTAVAIDRARGAVQEGGITAKIKAKMALDDSVKAFDISVDTDGSIVTLSGVVGSAAQRERAVQLARETEGVTQVVDQLRLRN
jgi:osmotically-inducible protein OsmY